MSRKVLSVEDTRSYREKYEQIVNAMGITAIVAGNVETGIEQAIQYRPCAIITDYALPDGTGNDLAKKVKETYDARIGGITGGNPNDFDSSYVDIQESKRISNERFKTLVTLLIESGDPKKEYQDSILDRESYEKKFNEALLNLTAIDILVQGYEIGMKARNGDLPEGIDVPVRSKEEICRIFEPDADFDVAKIYAQAKSKMKPLIDYSRKEGTSQEFVEIAEKMTNDTEINAFINAVKDKRYDEIGDSYKAFHDTFAKLMDIQE